MIEKILSWSAIGSAVLFAMLGLAAVMMSNASVMVAAIVVLVIAILLAISILIFSALPKDRPD